METPVDLISKDIQEQRKAGEARYRELLVQMKDITNAMHHVTEQQDALRAEWDRVKVDVGLDEVKKNLKGDEIENQFNFLQEEYDRLNRDYEEREKQRKESVTLF